VENNLTGEVRTKPVFKISTVARRKTSTPEALAKKAKAKAERRARKLGYWSLEDRCKNNALYNRQCGHLMGDIAGIVEHNRRYGRADFYGASSGSGKHQSEEQKRTWAQWRRAGWIAPVIFNTMMGQAKALPEDVGEDNFNFAQRHPNVTIILIYLTLHLLHIIYCVVDCRLRCGQTARVTLLTLFSFFPTAEAARTNSSAVVPYENNAVVSRVSAQITAYLGRPRGIVTFLSFIIGTVMVVGVTPCLCSTIFSCCCRRKKYAEAEVQTDKPSTLITITPSGDCYHRGECHYLRGRRGETRRPCESCRPDFVGSTI
jgi:hypothetical protein